MGKPLGIHFNMEDEVVGVFYLSLLKNQLEQEGLRLTGFDGSLDILDDEKARISPSRLYRTLIESLRYVPEGFGLRYGKALNLVAAETVGQLVMSCPNLGQAFEIVKRFHLLLSISFSVEELTEGNLHQIRLVPTCDCDMPSYLRHFLGEVLFSSVLTQARWLTGNSLNFYELSFAYEKPRHSKIYEDYFRCPVHYGSGCYGMTFDASYLDLPILTANEQLRKIKLNCCVKALQKWERKFSIENRVKGILAETYPEFVSLDQAAIRLHMSRSCLYRKLQDSHTSYQSLIREFRTEQSIKLLKKTTLSVSEIAEELGFSDASSFRRAFKNWTGMQPSVIRT